MEQFGVNYDLGVQYDRRFPVALASRDTVRADLRAIGSQLGANAVKLNGSDPDRLMEAAEIARELGLHVWITPRIIDGNEAETLLHLVEVARGAEDLRRNSGPEIVLVVGCEFTLDTTLFVPGANIHARGRDHFTFPWLIRKVLHLRQPYQRRFEGFVGKAAGAARESFHGRLTYAAGLWETVDWRLFDIVSINLYRAKFNERRYARELRAFRHPGKPFANTEFGCCAQMDGDRRGPTGYQVLDFEAVPPRFKEPVERSEQTQADYVASVLETLQGEQVDMAFVFEFITRHLPHDEGLDLDRASFAITKWIQDSPGAGHWEPKESFDVLTRIFQAQVKSSSARV